MSNLFKISIIIFLLIGNQNSYSQGEISEVDSLWLNWSNTNNHDTLRAYSLEKYIWKKYIFTNPDSSLILGKIEFDFTENLKEKKWNAYALNTIGISHYFLGNIDSATHYQLEAIKLKEKLKMWDKVTNSYNNLGAIHHGQGNYDLALKFYNKALKIRIELKDSAKLGSSYSNIGLIYFEQGAFNKALDNYYESIRFSDTAGLRASYNNIGLIFEELGSTDKALEYYNKSIEISIKENDEVSLSDCYNNVGLLYFELKDFEKADEFLQKSLEIRIKHNHQNGLCASYSNMGLLEMELGNYIKAKEYYYESLKIAQNINDKREIAIVKIQLGIISIKQNEYDNALKFCKEGLVIAQEHGLLEAELTACECLYESNKKAARISEAFQYLERFSELKDSIKSKDFKKDLISKDLKFEYDRRSLADSIKHIQKAKLMELEYQSSAEKKNLITYFLIVLSAVILVFFIIIYNRLKLTRTQKTIIEETNEELNQTNEELAAQRDEIENQKNKVEAVHQEIKDSINYAKRIQNAILPAQNLIDQYLPKSFVFYKPKDVVAGDFYWLEEKDGNILFAAADCTGHGVPGAMVSVVCNNGLNRAVREHNLVVPGEILNKTRDIVLEEFSKSEDEVSDGMDIAICSIKKNKLQYAGANVPLWIVRDNEVLITKPDKQPIGKFQDSSPFTTHNLELKENDIIYVFSDGFPDQFGGDKGKKLGYKKLRELFVEISNLDMGKQKIELESFFNEWKIDEEQVDDVCVMGIKI